MIDISNHEAYVYTIANAIDLFDVHDMSIFWSYKINLVCLEVIVQDTHNYKDVLKLHPRYNKLQSQSLSETLVFF